MLIAKLKIEHIISIDNMVAVDIISLVAADTCRRVVGVAPHQCICRVFIPKRQEVVELSFSRLEAPLKSVSVDTGILKVRISESDVEGVGIIDNINQMGQIGGLDIK